MPSSLEIRWEGMSGKNNARFGDLSMGGCYVNSPAQPTLGEYIRLEMHLPAGTWLPLQGEVVHQHTAAGFGVRFTYMSEEARSFITMLVFR